MRFDRYVAFTALVATVATTSTAAAQGSCGNWEPVSTPNPPSGHNALIGLDAWDSDTAFALRGGGVGSFVHEWDGTAWSETPLPTLDVEGIFSPRAITAAGGYAWTAALVTNGLANPAYQHLLRWNGTEWDLEEWLELEPDMMGNRRSGSPEDMDGVSADDIWIVGIADGTGNPNAGNELLTVHWNGSELVEYSTSGPGGRQNWLTGVTCIAPDDAWAVGYYNNTGDGGAFRAMIYHWDGVSWQRDLDAPLLVNSHLYDIDHVSADDVWAVGSHAGDPLVMHYDGVDWSVIPAPSFEFVNSLNAVAAAGPSNVWAATGGNDFVRWNGSTCEIVAFPEISGATNVDLHGGMAAVGGCDVWAVGGQMLDGRIYTLAAHLDGNVVDVPLNNPLTLSRLRNAPNPFRSRTTIHFDFEVEGDVTVEVFDVAGRRVHVEGIDASRAARGAVELSTDAWLPGVYTYRVRAGDTVYASKFIRVR